MEHLCPVDYRTEIREAKARVDLPAHRAVLDEFGYSLDLLLHAIESQLKETGERTFRNKSSLSLNELLANLERCLLDPNCFISYFFGNSNVRIKILVCTRLHDNDKQLSAACL